MISRLQRAADERRAAAQHVDLDAFAMRIAEQDLLGGRALAPQTAALPDRKLFAESGFRQPREREIEIIAAEQQMLAQPPCA